MNGSPIARVALILLFLGALAWPVWSLTRERPDAAPAIATALPVEKTVEVDLVLMSSIPTTVEVAYAALFKIKSEVTSRVRTKMRLPAGEKIDLLIKGSWPASSTPQALRVVVSWDGEDLQDKTFWGLEGIEDVVSFTAPKP